MIHELRTYNVRPGHAAEYLELAGGLSRPIRGDRFGKLLGYWSTEHGALNQVVHLWEYADVAARAQARAGLAKEERWVKEYVPRSQPLLVSQENMLLSPLEDPGLTVLPTHRVTTTTLPPYPTIKTRLEATFDLKEFLFSGGNRTAVRALFIETLRSHGRTAPTFGLALKGENRYVTLSLKPSHLPDATGSPRARLDVSLLQQLVVSALCPTQQEQEAILYTKDDNEALDWAADGTGTGALLLNATKVSEVQAVAKAGERMPHKSTYFYPKPLTGRVINVMEE